MPIERVVVDASPLIVLFRCNLENLLPQLFREIIVPGAVWHEIIDTGHADRAALGLPEASWIKRVDNIPDPAVIAWDLGPGETSVISFALKNPGYLAMIDDAVARNCSGSFDIPTLGTAGLLLRQIQKRFGQVPSWVEEKIPQADEAQLEQWGDIYPDTGGYF